MSAATVLVLIGDSDIDRWPDFCLPDIDGCIQSRKYGFSGATLADIVPNVASVVNEHFFVHDGRPEHVNDIVLIVCAGENDIGQGLSLERSESAFQSMLRVVFHHSQSHRTRLVFLGPKFEPWLQSDKSARRKYIEMSRSFQRICETHPQSAQITFIECLLMFCGDSATVPGAILGGKANADSKYFEKDQLHLNECGYLVWKSVIESKMENRS